MPIEVVDPCVNSFMDCNSSEFFQFVTPSPNKLQSCSAEQISDDSDSEFFENDFYEMLVKRYDGGTVKPDVANVDSGFAKSVLTNSTSDSFNVVRCKNDIKIPTVSHLDSDLKDATKFEMPAWQRMIADTVSADLLDCVVNANHKDYDDLLCHSYLDDKTWSLEQKFTFS